SMCRDCGCSITHANEHLLQTGGVLAPPRQGTHSVSLLTPLLVQNDREAQHNRQHFDSHSVLAINLMSSPGAGKTALLERTIEALQGRLRMAVIEGDLATENDARRIRAKGVPAVQITTGSACHLDAHMVHDALHELDLTGLDIVFIENVGNLVCPASFDLGQHLNVTLLSVPEGDDKPEKYPVMFRAADLLLLTKCDLLTVLPEFDVNRAQSSLRTVGSDVPVMHLSSRTGTGIDAWCQWLLDQRNARAMSGPSAAEPRYDTQR
ncbi:MAG TPA: hydrogenase nickel incorporation protein HypB, partial [Steroidobacteraceae bacterium]